MQAILSFNTYKWKFWWTGETTITNPTVATPISVVLGSLSISKDIYGLCTGDWNGSYTLGKSASESLTLNYGKTMQVSPAEFELPLYAGWIWKSELFH